MQVYGKAEDVATRILRVFESGALPRVLAPVFVHRRDSVPCRAWSWSNQMLTALAGTSDARGFRQWETVGRRVCKGAKAFHILGPVTRKVEDRDDESGEVKQRVAVVGFKSIPVFAMESTEVCDAEKWAAANKGAEEAQRFVDGLPVVEVARGWGLGVELFNGQGARYLGYYRHRAGIALGVENLSTWAHELCHAADDRCVHGLKGGQDLDQEVVAELGGAVLLTCLGLDVDADLGGAWQYIESYCKRAKKAPITVCEKLLARVCEAVAMILDTADTLVGAETDKGVAA